ncbi:MAG: hypothetical protein ACLTYW_03255 [Collinsella sp.]
MERILGVNLSGWFIPEPWVTPSLYAATGASNAAELQEAMGTAAYNERMRRHYETFVSEDDFRRMAQIGLNAVRLPVPWYAFGSQESDAPTSRLSITSTVRLSGLQVQHPRAADPGDCARWPGRFQRFARHAGGCAEWHSSTTAVMLRSTCSSAWPVATARPRACWALSCWIRRR